MTIGVVLDLDNTLIHGSSKVPSIEEMSEKETEIYRVQYFNPELNQFEWIWMAVRPGTRDFLKTLSEIDQLVMVVYTNATNGYANIVMDLLDPDGKYFGIGADRRLIFRATDDHRKYLSTVVEKFNLEDQELIIIDDREDVWLQSEDAVSPQSLMIIKAYKWFENGFLMRINRFRGINPQLDEYLDCRDDYLQPLRFLGPIIRKLCSGPDKVVPNMIAFKSTVFKGCHFGFTGIVKKMEDESTSPLFQECRTFGAQCYSSLTDDIMSKLTHFIVGKSSKDDSLSKKERDVHRWNAQSMGQTIHVVTYEWLVDSLATWTNLPTTESQYHRKYRV